ncbi:MAG: 1-acyl-sn-glycerol-3-phosphate acyltransferase [Paludibacteraceae bacterium]
MFYKFDFKYTLAQLKVNPVFRLHFRKLIFTGQENIPRDKPIIYAPTHRNALVDALILVHENVKQQVVFLARADIFKKELVVKILHFMRIMPVYRIRDGKENLSKNQEIFEICGRILQNGSPLCLFPEAKYNPHQNLLPLQKAIPRIALPTEAANNFMLNIHIVPVAFYYTAKDCFLSDLYVTYGKPVKVADYKELYEKDENHAINQLRLDLDTRLRKYVVDIPEQDYDEYVALIDVNARTLAYKSFPESDGIVHASQQIIKKLNGLKEARPEEYSSKILSVKQALEFLKNNGLTAKDPITKPRNILIRSFLLLISSPIAFAGLLNSIFPILIFKKLLSLFKDKQFISSLRIVCGIFVVPVFYILQTIIVGLITKSTACALTYLLASPTLFYFGNYWRKWLRGAISVQRVNQFIKEKKGDWEQIVNALKLDI